MRAGFLNLGVDGQIYVGAATATGAAFAIGGGVPTVVAVVVVVVAGAIGGALFGLIPAVLRVRYGVNELFVSVMLNFVGFYIVDWLATGPWTDPLAGEAITRSLGFEWRLPRLFEGAHIGIAIAIPIAVALSLWLSTTRRGFEFRSAGSNPAAARLGGVSLWRTGLVALVVSGAVAGVAGGIELAGVHGRLVSGLSPNYGYMSVLAAVLAKRSPLLAIPVSFGFAVLLVGSDALQGSIGLPSSAVLIFQALVVLSVLFFEALRGGRRPNFVVGKGTP
jgi:simple sugar transport system permease protein